MVQLVNEFNLRTRQSQAAAERRFIEHRVEQVRSEFRAAEDDLQNFLQNNRAFQNSPELLFQHDRLQREVSMQQQVFTNLMQSYEQARIAEVRNTPVITVVEKAEVPVMSDRGGLRIRILIGAFLGLLLGSFTAFFREYARRKQERQSSDLDEISELWEEAKQDLRRLAHRLKTG